MLEVTAFELSDPVVLGVEMKPGDGSLHGRRSRVTQNIDRLDVPGNIVGRAPRFRA